MGHGVSGTLYFRDNGGLWSDRRNRLESAEQGQPRVRRPPRWERCSQRMCFGRLPSRSIPNNSGLASTRKWRDLTGWVSLVYSSFSGRCIVNKCRGHGSRLDNNEGLCSRRERVYCGCGAQQMGAIGRATKGQICPLRTSPNLSRTHRYKDIT